MEIIERVRELPLSGASFRKIFTFAFRFHIEDNDTEARVI